MKKECPNCRSFFDLKDIVSTGPKLKDNPKWYETSHINGDIQCPLCGKNLKLRIMSLWPVSLFVPASIAYFMLPTFIDALVMISISLVMVGLLIFTFTFEVKDL